MNVKSILNYAKKVEADNKAFKHLPKKAQRLAIAKDAMAQLLTGKYEATCGTYVRIEGLDEKDDVLKALAAVPSCNVCAIGSLLVSGIRHGECRGKNLTGYNDDELFYDGEEPHVYSYVDGVKLAFTERMLRRMEHHFEQSDVPDSKYGLIESDDARLFAILENIIENGGDFKDSPDPKWDDDVHEYTFTAADRKWARAVIERFERARLTASKVAA